MRTAAKQRDLLKVNAQGITDPRAANADRFYMDPLCDNTLYRIDNTGRKVLAVRNHHFEIVDPYANAAQKKAEERAKNDGGLTDAECHRFFVTQDVNFQLLTATSNPAPRAKELVGFRSANLLPLSGSADTTRVEHLVAKGAGMNDDLITDGNMFHIQYTVDADGNPVPRSAEEVVIYTNFARMDARTARAGIQLDGLNRIVAGVIHEKEASGPSRPVAFDSSMGPTITTPINPSGSFGGPSGDPKQKLAPPAPFFAANAPRFELY